MFQGGYMIPAMKYAVAKHSGIEQWKIVRPPLVEMPVDAATKLEGELTATAFQMPGYPIEVVA